MVNFGEVLWAQLAKFTLFTSTFVPLGSFQIFKVSSNAKERVGCGKQWEATSPLQSLINYSLGSRVCCGRPALGRTAV